MISKLFKKIPPIPLLTGVGSILLSIIIILSSIVTHKEYLEIRSELVEVPAVIVNINVTESSGEGSSDIYTAYVDYTYKGATYDNTLWQIISKDEFKVGQTTQITIDPLKPDKPYIYDGDLIGHISVSVLFLGIGIIILCFGYNFSKHNS